MHPLMPLGHLIKHLNITPLNVAYLGVSRNVESKNFTSKLIRVSGPSTYTIPYTQQHPWLCSLKTRGFRGFHRCGVTLLSGPPRRTILVSAAHCSFICKNKFGEILEMCCCRNHDEAGSCLNVSKTRMGVCSKAAKD